MTFYMIIQVFVNMQKIDNNLKNFNKNKMKFIIYLIFITIFFLFDQTSTLETLHKLPQ